jgi:hypothetical protein
MTRDIRRVFAFSPVSYESWDIQFRHFTAMHTMEAKLKAVGCKLSFEWASDGCQTLWEGDVTLIKHDTHLGLATTLADAYTAILQRFHDSAERPDIIVRLDSQEHNPRLLRKIVQQMRSTDVEALFLPVMYEVREQPRHLMRDIYANIIRLDNALHPVDTKIVSEIYNNIFPMGYQCFTWGLLQRILPHFLDVMALYQSQKSRPAMWGMDLVSLVLAKQFGSVDFLFGGFMKPWESNRPPEKIAEQAARVEEMLGVLMGLPELAFR